MVDKRLLDYVKTNLEEGYPIETIRKTLAGVGWPLPEIDEALDIAQGRKPGEPPRPEPPKPTPPKTLPPGPVGKKARAGFAVSVIAGILMIITSIANLLVGFVGFPYKDLGFLYNLGIITQDEIAITSALLSPLGQALTIIAFILGIIVIVGSIFMRKPGRASMGGKLVLICSILNFIALWGMGLLGILAAVIGVVGGILGIMKK